MGFSELLSSVLAMFRCIGSKTIALGWLMISVGYGQNLSPTLAPDRPLAVQPKTIPANGGKDSSDSLIEAFERKVQALLEQSKGSVVAIARVRRQKDTRQQVFQFQLGRNNPVAFERSPDSNDFVPEHFGAGIVWDEEGTIVTAYHVLDDPREHDYWVWADGRPLQATVANVQAKVMAGDPYTDLAVLKVEPKDLRPIRRANPNSVEQGQFVVHLGNPQAIARDGRMSAGWGIVANIQRSIPKPHDDPSGHRETLAHYGNLLEIDSRLPVGTSGGALLDLEGNCIGLTIAPEAVDGLTRSSGFAIPVDASMERAVSGLKEGRLPSFGFLGIQPDDRPVEDRSQGKLGALVSAVVRGMPGDLAGIREGDIVVAVDEQRIDGRDALFRELSRKGPESTVSVKLIRRNPANQQENELIVHPKLSKKYVSTRRPSYSIHPEPQWRGIRIEYATALPPEMMRFPVRVRGVNQPALAVLEVEPNSPAWKAGIRPGYALLSVDGELVVTPDQFDERTRAANERSVRLRVVNHREKSEEIVEQFTP